MMKTRTITVDVGPVDLHHNNREFQYYKNKETPDWIDLDKTKDNITYVRKNPTAMLNQMFKDGVREYNEKQKRKDRRYANVSDYTKSQCGRKYKWKYELIVQVGGMNDMGVNSTQIDQENARNILDEFAKTFVKKYPNLKVFNMVLHLDESTPHLHISYCPVYSEPEHKKKFNGCRTKISHTKAMIDMGYTPEELEKGKFFHDIRDEVKTIMGKYGYEYEPIGKNDKDRTAQEQREFQKSLEKRIKQADKTIKELVNEEDLKQEDISVVATKLNTQYRDIEVYKGLVKEKVIEDTNLELENYRKEEKEKKDEELTNIDSKIRENGKILAQTNITLDKTKRAVLDNEKYLEDLDEEIIRRENQTFDERDELIDYLGEVIATATNELPVVGEVIADVMDRVYDKRMERTFSISDESIRGIEERKKLLGLEFMIKKFRSKINNFLDMINPRTKRRTRSDDYER